MSPPLSIALNVANRPCLVVGGGAVAYRRADALLRAGATVTIVAPLLALQVEQLVAEGAVTVIRRAFEAADLQNMLLVVAATNDPVVNREVAALARARRVLVNRVDDPDDCDFMFPAVVHRGDVQIAITTAAQAPALARHLRHRIEQTVPAEYARLAPLLAALRIELRGQGVQIDPETWQRAIDDHLLALVREGQIDEAIALVRSRLLHSAD